MVRRVSVQEAKKLLDDGYLYLDVRTVEEFAACHPAGAVNVPLSLLGPAGTTANTEFVPLILKAFSREAKIIVGCAQGVRSLRAAEMLAAAGFGHVVEMRAGLDGLRNAFGAKTEKGWADEGLPVASGSDDGDYQKVRAR
jgi:rhodanese-related sulfurtransferase